jgi:hypothetical protein
MVMVVHEHEGVESPSVHLDRSAEPIEPLEPVGVIAHDRPAFDASRHHVIQSTRKLDSQRSGHGPILADFRSPAKA